MWAYPWGEGELLKYTGPDIWQAEILSKIGEGVLSIQEAISAVGDQAETSPILEATTSGHGIGKSALVAWIIHWAMATMEDTKGVVTANTETQLKTKTWAELSKWHRLFIARKLFKMTATAIFSVDPDHERTWRIDMVPWSEKNTEAFAGMHNSGKRILVLFDEASAIPDLIWEVTEGALTDKATEIIWAVFGNPTKNTGRFRECFKGGKFSHRWSSRAIDSRTVEITNKAQLQQWVDDYGEDHDFTRVRVKGQFPHVDATSFISLEDVIESMKRPLVQTNLPWILGVDVARYGPDASVIAFRRGKDARSKSRRRYQGLNTVQLASRVFDAVMETAAAAVFVDSGGVGGGVVDQLEAMGVVVFPVDFGGKADDIDSGEKCLNKRAEIYLRMNKWLKEGGCLPLDESDGGLRDQLTAPTYTFTRGDTLLQLESKKDLKRRLGISPDDADALAVTFAYPWATAAPALTESLEESGKNSQYTDTNPYEELQNA